MDSPQRAKKADVLSQATDILGKRPQSLFYVSVDEDERFNADGINSGPRRLRRKVRRTSTLFPGWHDLSSLSRDGDQERVTRFAHRQHEQQVVTQSRGGRKGITGNQPQQFATRTMTRSQSQQRMLQNTPDSQLSTAPKGHQSIAGPSRTSNHKTGEYTAYADLGHVEIAVNPKTSSARDYTSPSDTGEFVDGPVEVTTSLRPALTRDYKKDRPNQLYRVRYSCKRCSTVFTRKDYLKRHIHNRHGEIHDRTTSDRTNVSSSSSFGKSSKKESYEGTPAKSNDTRHHFPLSSSRTACIPGAQVNTALMGSIPPGANPNSHTLQYLNSAAKRQILQQQHFNNLQAVEAMRQQQPLQRKRARQLTAQQAAIQANMQDGLPINMTQFSQLNPQGHHSQAQPISAQKLTTQRYQQLQQEQKRQARQLLLQGSDIDIDTDHWTMDTDHWTMDTDQWTVNTDQWTIDTWDNKESIDKRDAETRRLKTDFRDPSANFSAIGHHTISQDNTDGEEARQSLLLAEFGKRCTRNRDAQEFEKQKTLRKGRV